MPDAMTTAPAQTARPLRQGDTPFMAFWGAINAEMATRNLPDLTYGPARSLWQRTVAEESQRQRAATYQDAVRAAG